MAKAVKGEVVTRIRLSPKQELFCQYYATDREFFGNGAAAYIEAYQPSRLRMRWYSAARSSAARLLTNANICQRINQLLEEGGLNEQNVDKQLAFLVTQHADKMVKLGAIREYNKLKARITEKHEHEVKVKTVEVMEVGDGIDEAGD